jgi:hypothetical protein
MDITLKSLRLIPEGVVPVPVSRQGVTPQSDGTPGGEPEACDAFRFQTPVALAASLFHRVYGDLSVVTELLDGHLDVAPRAR